MKRVSFCLAIVVILAVGSPVFATTHYVDLNSTNPISPYVGWDTAATNIQDAIDVSSDGDLVMVTNGVYQTGGRLADDSTTNRVVIDKAITLQSVNGPSVTMIEGNSVLNSNAVRCVYMAGSSVLSGFTLTNGGTLNSGGGVWATNLSGVISNCVLIGNVAHGMGGGACNANICNSLIVQNSAYSGGGVGLGVGTFTSMLTVENSLIAGNSATAYGGGAWLATLKNCKVIGNTAGYGGGTSDSSLYGCSVISNSASQIAGGILAGMFTVNCTIIGNSSYQGAGGIGAVSGIYNSIIYHNTVTIGSSSNYDSSVFVNCCTTPPIPNNINSITNEPGFVDANNGDFHLAPNSPCINGGRNLQVFNRLAADLDGNPRIVDGLVDIGAYECQTPGFVLPYYWMQEYGLPSDGTMDSDQDGMNNWEEAVADTIPTNAASVLRVSIFKASIPIVQWSPGSVSRVYYVQRSTNLLANPAFISIYTNYLYHAPRFSFFDFSATNGGPYFYRVCVY